jgi:hypothetical protein
MKQDKWIPLHSQACLFGACGSDWRRDSSVNNSPPRATDVRPRPAHVGSMDADHHGPAGRILREPQRALSSHEFGPDRRAQSRYVL